MVEIRFVWHDCFVVSTDECSMVFDYWRDDAGESVLARLDRAKPLYVFVSHGHKDHFNPEIFSWASEFENIVYVVSRDVFKRMRHVLSPTSVYNGPRLSPGQVVPLRAGEEFGDSLVKVRAFPSTDIGNSYAVETSGRRIFHAGDLNAWLWVDVSTESEVRKAAGDYRACLRDIREAGITGFDYAFFPVDSRIGTDYFAGARMFVNEFDVARFFPMHFCLGDESEVERRRRDALRFDLYANTQRGEYIGLSKPGDIFLDCHA